MENSRDLFKHEQIPVFLQPYSFIHDAQLSRCVQTSPFPADIHSTAFRSLRVLFPIGDAFYDLPATDCRERRARVQEPSPSGKGAAVSERSETNARGERGGLMNLGN